VKNNLRKLTNLHKSEAFKHSRFSRANLTIFAIIFASIGGYLVYSSFAAGGTCTQTFTTGNYSASSISSAATGGAVLCLSSGTYGGLQLSQLHPSSMVTIQPAPGATVNVGRFNLNAVSNITITGFSGSSTSGGIDILTSGNGTNSNITFSYNAMTAAGVNIGNNDIANANIIIDHNTFIGFTAAGEQDRLLVNTANSTHCPNGVMISNNLISGGRSDGIDIDGGTCGTKIYNNEITGLHEDTVCGGPTGIHCDPIQDNGGGMKTDIENNYLHDNSDGILFDDGNTGPDIIKNNVFDNPTYRCIEGQYGDGSIFDHNTFDCEVNVGQDHAGDPTTNITFTNNIFGPGQAAGFNLYPNLSQFGSFKVLDYNLYASGEYAGEPAGAHDISGVPTYNGGTEPSTLAGWQLASSSLGRLKASDGSDMGANVATVGIQASCTNTTAITPANFASAVTNAKTGDILCLSSGNYGTWTGANKAITVKADSGQSPTMAFNFSSGGGFTLDGIQGMSGDISGTAQNITIKNSVFTSQFGFDGSGGATGIIFDGNTHNYPFTSTDQNGPNAKIRIDNASGTIASPAITIENSDIENGDLDGVHIGGSTGSSGINILNNKFANICEAGVNHTDMLQWDIISPGASNERIAGNYFYAAPGCFTQPIGSYDAGTASVMIENNVVDQDAVGNSIELNGDGNGGTGSIVRHNTLVYHQSCFADGGNGCGQISMGAKAGDPRGQGTNVYDNIAANIQFLSGEATGTMDHNLCHTSECTGTGTIPSGLPTFVSSSPAAHDDYLLASGSLGKNAASDSTDMGISSNGSTTGGGGSSDTTSPTVSLTAPASGATVSGTSVTLSANASDNVGVSSVQFKVDGANVNAADTSSPYTTTWDSTTVANGSHTITGVARDAAGNSTTSSSVTVTVNNTGNVNIGETTITSADDSGNANILLSQQATLGQSASIQSLSFYVTNAAGKLRLGIYDATGPSSGPGAKKAETAEITPTTGWNTATTTTHPTLAAGTYWLAYLPSDNNLAFKKSPTSTTNSRYYTFTYGTLPNTFSTAPSTTPSHWSLYATLSLSTSPKTGDINGDNSVNITDLSLLLSSYNQNTTQCTTNNTYKCDLSSPGDGVVNIFDLSILLSHYGT